MKKYVLVSLSILFSSYVLMGAEKPFVSQPSERSVALLQHIPCEIFCHIFMQLEPLEALKKIEACKLVSNWFNNVINKNQCIDLQKQLLVLQYGSMMKELNEKYPKIISKNKPTEKPSSDEPTLKDLRVFFDESFRDYYAKKFKYSFKDINYTDSKGNTVLHKLVNNRSKVENKLDEVKEIITLLIKMGINLEAENKLQKTPLVVALDRSIADKLANEFSVFFKLQESIIPYDYIHLIEFLLQKGARPITNGVFDEARLKPEVKSLLKRYSGDHEKI